MIFDGNCKLKKNYRLKSPGVDDCIQSQGGKSNFRREFKD